MGKIIKATDVPGGNLTDAEFDFMFNENLRPTINEDDHFWKLIKVLKTDTKSVPWHISINGEYYVAVWSNSGRYTNHATFFYPSDENGKYTISLSEAVYQARNYLDMASACDEFVEEIASRN